MPVTTSLSDGVLTAYLSGDIDHHSAAEMREVIDHQAESCLPDRLVLDFGGVTFMDSSGIGLIMGRYKLMRSMHGTLAAANVSPRLKTIIHLAGADLLAAIEP